MKLTKSDFTIHKHDDSTSFMYLDNYSPYDMIEQILKNQGIIEQLEYRKKHPMAFNHAQFESWVTDILNGGNGFSIPKELIDETN